MPLIDARGFNLTPDLVGSLSRGQQVGTQFANQDINRQLLEQQAALRNQALAAGQQQFDITQGQQERLGQVRGLLGQFDQQAPQTAREAQLATQTADFAGQEGVLAQQAAAEQPRIMGQDELIRQARSIDPIVANKLLKEMGLDDASKRAEASRFAAQIQHLPYDIQNQKIAERIDLLERQGRNVKDTRELLTMRPDQRLQALQGVQMLDLSTKERLGLQAKKAKLTAEAEGLSEVQKATILDDGTVQFVRKDGTVEVKPLKAAEAEMIKRAHDRGIDIQQQRAQGRELGKSTAKFTDKTFETTDKLRANNTSLRKVIEEVKAGAGTGPLISKMPSFRAESVRLDQLRNRLGLDIIGSVTFGALSEGELQLALDTALDTRLDGPELVKWAEDKIAAQEKLAGYLEEQALFLSQKGKTRADWLKEKRRIAKESAGKNPAEMTDAELQAAIIEARGE